RQGADHGRLDRQYVRVAVDSATGMRSVRTGGAEHRGDLRPDGRHLHRDRIDSGCAAGTTLPACTTGLPAICGGTPTKITAATESSTTVTITSTVTGLIVGDKVAVTGVVPAGYDGIFTVTGTGAGTFTYTAASGLTSPGTVTNGYA